ncbi:uncharacterized protein LOC134847946 isoform X2 [Symsagittifera roscoffensis]|uniref:uncharacterized protein LOC134847946 isoform X2 n=1 Tax=Symsagittifera roscoffensis TaxID=84072 RepID=UPI00307C5E58
MVLAICFMMSIVAAFQSSSSGSFPPEICLRLPSSEVINTMSQFSYWAPECKQNPSVKNGCPENVHELDSFSALSVLTEPIKCFVHACQSNNGAEKVSIDDFKHAYNCNPEISKHGTCINPMYHLKDLKLCALDLKENKERLHAFREVIELYRYKSLCNAQFLELLKDSNIFDYFLEDLTPTIQYIEQACLNKCFYPLEHFDMFKPNPYFTTDEKTWYTKCKNFTWLQRRTFYSGTVHFRELKTSWMKLHEQCSDFRNDNANRLPNLLKFVPFPRNLISEEFSIDALRKCCKDKKYYDTFNHEKDNSHYSGIEETICMAPKKVIAGFGFTDWIIRGLIQAYSGQCWIEDAKHSRKCDKDAEIDQMNLNDISRRQEISPSDIFWFMRYVKNQTARNFALQACAVGSKLGRSVTILPGLVVSLEAQSYVIASSSEIPKEFKLLCMMAYQTCGVFASVHANAFFETGATCNEFVLDSFYLGDEIISGFHSEL